ncbi:class I SAM-dependent methyltransferase [Alteribacillus bidgolensis]|uniref:Methyltransferase domain-containing protein n=1 Tax=Alteribacillus bidgolensis TaxID=930129 RepID=A0A1G8QET4_9BACI|nr:class I SAM-dependent methyltransferase [Alteribacillus bidgolensis]SDJ03319.1 Methyltransferase domain-containing protein [Alteribacillus bidgolensis]
MLKDIEERIFPKEMKPSNGMLLEHLARYYFALPYAKGEVLDIACGSGYGAQMIAKAKKKEIKKIIGVDIEPNAIHYANQNYYHPLLTFRIGDVLDSNLKEKIGTFDTVISFETLEHVPNDKEFLKRLYSLLKPGGTLVVSTPFGQGRGKPCNSLYHYHQLTEHEFITLFTDNEECFEDVQFFYQQGVSVENIKRSGVRYPQGIAVCKKIV